MELSLSRALKLYGIWLKMILSILRMSFVGQMVFLSTSRNEAHTYTTINDIDVKHVIQVVRNAVHVRTGKKRRAKQNSKLILVVLKHLIHFHNFIIAHLWKPTHCAGSDRMSMNLCTRIKTHTHTYEQSTHTSAELAQISAAFLNWFACLLSYCILYAAVVGHSFFAPSHHYRLSQI